MRTSAGIGATCVEEWERAEGHFRKALEEAKSIPFRSEQADARRWYANMLLARRASGDPARAQQLLAEAITIYNDIRMPPHRGLAETFLAKA